MLSLDGDFILNFSEKVNKTEKGINYFEEFNLVPIDFVET